MTPARMPLPMDSSLGWYLYETVVPFAVIVVIMLLMRWAFSGHSSLVMRRPTSGGVQEYGLLVDVLRPRSLAEGETARHRLTSQGVKANLVTTTDGLALMVFAEDAARAAAILAEGDAAA